MDRDVAEPLDTRQQAPDDGQDHEAQREVDEEDPLPADGVGKDAADGRPDHGRQPEYRTQQP